MGGKTITMVNQCKISFKEPEDFQALQVTMLQFASRKIHA
jgi:hypothetical protein